MKYINENPTKTEKILFEKYGLYLIYKDKDSYRYAPIHIENQYVYPSSVEVENDMVEWEHDILFDIFTETVTIHVRVIPNWIWTEWVQVCTQLKKYPDAVNNIRIVTDNERLKRSEWNHKKQLENEVTKRN